MINRIFAPFKESSNWSCRYLTHRFQNLYFIEDNTVDILFFLTTGCSYQFPCTYSIFRVVTYVTLGLFTNNNLLDHGLKEDYCFKYFIVLPTNS